MAMLLAPDAPRVITQVDVLLARAEFPALTSLLLPTMPRPRIREKDEELAPPPPAKGPAAPFTNARVRRRSKFTTDRAAAAISPRTEDFAEERRRRMLPKVVRAVLAGPLTREPVVLRRLFVGVIVKAVMDVTAFVESFAERDRLTPWTLYRLLRDAVAADAWLAPDIDDPLVETPARKLTFRECCSMLDLDVETCRERFYATIPDEVLWIVWQGLDGAQAREWHRLGIEQDRAARARSEKRRRERWPWDAGAESDKCD